MGGEKNKLGGHQHPSPCLILSKPSKHQSKFHIQMPAPFESEEYWVHPEQFQISFKNKEHVSKVEQTWINHYGTLLGYDSIEEQRNPNLYGDDEEEREAEDDVKGINAVIKLNPNKKLGRHRRNTP